MNFDFISELEDLKCFILFLAQIIFEKVGRFENKSAFYINSTKRQNYRPV